MKKYKPCIKMDQIRAKTFLNFGQSGVLIYSFNFGNDVFDFIFDGRLFHIFEPKDLKLWVQNLVVYIRLTMMSF